MAETIIQGLYQGAGGRIDIGYELTQSIENNTTTVAVTAYVVKTNASYYSYRSSPVTFKLTVNGNEKTYGWTFNFSNLALNQRYAITSHSQTVAHNTDGTKSNVAVSVYCATGTDGLGTISGSTSIAIPTIPRATQPTLSASTTAMGSAVTINTPRASTAFTHTLKYSFNGATGTIATGVATSYAWTIPLSLANQIPNNISGSGTITCETYSGSTLIGTKTVAFTATVPSSVVPTVSIAKTGVDLYSSKYVQNKSKVTVTLTAAGAYSSTISSRSTTVKAGTVLISSSTANSFTSGILTYSGTITIATTVTDSRGRTATASTTITVVAYATPRITAFSAFRANSDGSANPQGAYIRITGTSSISSIDSTNTKSTTLKYRVAGTSTWTTAASNTDSYTPSLAATVAADINSSFEVQMAVTDYYTSTTSIKEVSTAFVLMDFNASGTGMAIGKVSEIADALEIDLPTYFDGIQGYIVESGNNANGNYIKYGDGTMICIIGGIAIAYESSSTYIQVVWTFPASFYSNPAVITVRTASATPGVKFLRAVPQATAGGSSATIRLGATYGDSFVSGDEAIMQAIAIGRWKAW